MSRGVQTEFPTAFIFCLFNYKVHNVHLLTDIFVCLFAAAGNESCPQPQTSEHLAAIEIMKLKHIIILQNKIDLIRDSQAKDQYQEILKFVQGRYIGPVPGGPQVRPG